jgi:Na+/proline symporter
LFYAQHPELTVHDKGDTLLPTVIGSGMLGQTALVLFVIGIVASAVSSADSALTALTTSFCIDIRGSAKGVAFRKRTHVVMTVVFLLVMLGINAIGSSSILDLIYMLAGFTYGPLLGLFAFGMSTRLLVHDRWVPYVAVASPLLCWLIDLAAQRLWNYHFGYELLMLNGLLTFVGLLMIRKRTR